MKRRWKLFLAGIAILAVLALFLPQGGSNWEPPRVLRPLFDLLPHQTIYALGNRDVEFTLFVYDVASGQPIPGAEFTIWTREQLQGEPAIKLVTDDTGRAKVLRKDVTCEDIIRSFHKTVTHINAHWCTFDLQAEGYQPIEHGGLADYPYDDKGWSRQEHLHRAEYKISLVKKN
jgi:hypothetical protein